MSHAHENPASDPSEQLSIPPGGFWAMLPWIAGITGIVNAGDILRHLGRDPASSSISRG